MLHVAVYTILGRLVATLGVTETLFIEKISFPPIP